LKKEEIPQSKFLPFTGAEDTDRKTVRKYLRKKYEKEMKVLPKYPQRSESLSSFLAWAGEPHEPALFQLHL
jgi:transposase